MTSLTLLSDFPDVIDNTAREQFRLCPQHFFYSTIGKISSNPPSVDLHAGGAYAMGLEVLRKSFYDEGLSQEEALERGVEALIRFYGSYDPPEGHVKTSERMAGALVSYVEKYPLAEDFLKPYRLANGKSAVEFTFAIPLDIPHPETGNPILYAGRFDMLAVMNDTLFVEDDKTTKQLGQTWGAQWDLNSQFTGYCWAAKAHDLPVAGAVIRGQSILKTGYGHAQAIIYRPQWMINRWLTQLYRDIERMIETWKSGYYDYALGGACSHYGGCPFKRLCASPEPQNWLDGYYMRKVWNPCDKDPEANAVARVEEQS